MKKLMKIIDFLRNAPFNQISKNQGKVQQKYNQGKYRKFKEKNRYKLHHFIIKPSKYPILIRAFSECLKPEREDRILSHLPIVEQNQKKNQVHCYI